MYRGYVARRDYQQARYLIERVQAIWRGRTARGNLDRLRQLDAATTIQASWRAFKARRALEEQRSAAVALQCAWRCKVRHATPRSPPATLTPLNHLAPPLHHGATTPCTHTTPQLFEVWGCGGAKSAGVARWPRLCMAQVASRELRQLRQEARESTKLLEDKKALEAKVQELQATLAVVQDQRNELRQQVRVRLALLPQRARNAALSRATARRAA